MVEIRSEEGCEIGPCLRDYKVVYVEKFGYAVQRRLAIGVRGVCPGTKGSLGGWRTGYDGTRFVLAHQNDRVIERGGRGCIRSERGGPNELGLLAASSHMLDAGLTTFGAVR